MFSRISCWVGAAPGGGALEGIEVHAHEVDELDAVRVGLDHVLRVVAQREQAGVEPRVQRLDAAAHDLREAGEVLDRADGEPRGAQLGGGAARRHELDAESGQAPRELDDAALVRDGQERSADADVARLRHAWGPAGVIRAHDTGARGRPRRSPHAR